MACILSESCLQKVVSFDPLWQSRQVALWRSSWARCHTTFRVYTGYCLDHVVVGVRAVLGRFTKQHHRLDQNLQTHFQLLFFTGNELIVAWIEVATSRSMLSPGGSLLRR